MSVLILNNLMTLHINKDLSTSTVHVVNIEHSEYKKFVYGNAINI